MFPNSPKLNNQVAAVIVSHNGGDRILDCISSLVRQVDQLLIIDNASNPCSRSIVQTAIDQYSTKVSVQWNHANAGVAHALNSGATWATNLGSQWLLTMDQDTTLPSGTVDHLLEAVAQDSAREQIAIAAPQTMERQTGMLFGLGRVEQKNQQLQDVRLIHTSGNLLRISAYHDIGPYRDEFFVDQVDYEFCLRAVSAGYRIVVAPHVVAFHELGQSRPHRFLGKSFVCTHHSPVRHYYMARNKTRLFLERREWWFIRTQGLGVLKDIIKILLFENEKVTKMRMIFNGLVHGLFRQMGQHGDSAHARP